MNSYEIIKLNSDNNKECNIYHKATNSYGVALPTTDGNIKVFYGKDDGSDDRILTEEQFNIEFEIVK